MEGKVSVWKSLPPPYYPRFSRNEIFYSFIHQNYIENVVIFGNFHNNQIFFQTETFPKVIYQI